jgi:hypothetical protein
MAGKPRRLGEPDIWKLIQEQGAIETLVVMSKSHVTHLRVRDFRQCLPDLEEATLRRRLNEFINTGCMGWMETYDTDLELVPWVFLRPRGAKLAEAALLVHDHARSYEPDLDLRILDLPDPLPDMPPDRAFPPPKDSPEYREPRAQVCLPFTAEESRRITDETRRVPYQWRDR